MNQEIKIELLKFRVPLSDAWEQASKALLNLADRKIVEELALAEAIALESKMTDSDYVDTTDRLLLETARKLALDHVQTKFSGSLPELADRESNLLTQHNSIWLLLGQLFKANGGRSLIQGLVCDHALTVLQNAEVPFWKSRASSVLRALSSLKGTTDERINSLCLSDAFLCERELVTPSIRLVLRSEFFKKLMNAPDMVTDGEKTLPNLLLNLSNDKEFRQAFVWLPLDPENPLNVAGGSGVMPTDWEGYRYILRIIIKILFGKLRQRGNGIDKRSSFAERQGQIMSYLGTIPVREVGIVFQVLFSRVISPGIDLESVVPEWSGSEFVDAKNGQPILNRQFLEPNENVRAGIIKSMAHLIAQMKRKVDRFAPLLAVFVVSCLSWGLFEEARAKPALQRLAELMETYPQMKSREWLKLLSPIADVLRVHLSRSSAAEVSTVFRIVTQWCYSDDLTDLYSSDLGQCLLTELFSPRALSGTPAKALFSMVLTLCGEDAFSSTKVKSYVDSRKDMMREHKRTGGDMDSDDEDSTGDQITPTPPEDDQMIKNQQIVLSYATSIVEIVSLSLEKAADKTQALRVTVSIAKLVALSSGASLPESACTKLLELISDQLKQISNLPPRKARLASGQACLLFEASSQVSSLIVPDAIPRSLLPTASRLLVTMDDVRGRVLLSQCILELARKTSVADIKAAEKLVELNSFRASGASLQPDIDTHVDVFQDVLDLPDDIEVDYFLSSVALIRHCLFLVSSIACDTTVRHCAERFLSLVGRVRDEQGRLPVPRLLMVVNHLHKVLDNHSSDATYRSALKLIVSYAKEYACLIDETVDSENARLLHKDLLPFIESSVLDDLQHIQKYRRSRALAKLADQHTLLTEYTKSKLLAPLAVDGIMQPGVGKASYDSALGDASVKAIQVCPTPVDVMIKLVKVYLRKFEEREKIILRAVSKMTETLVSGQVRTLSEAELVRVETVLVSLLRKRVFDSKGGLKGSTLIGDQSDKHRLARERGPGEQDGLVKIDAVVALLEVLKLLPSSTLASQTEQLVRIVLKGLPSRELVNRRAAREALRRCAKALGPTRLAWLMKEIRHTLPRGGFQGAVAVFTCFSVVESLCADLPSLAEELAASPSITAAEIAAEVLECVRIEDKQWAMMQSRSDGAIDDDLELSKQCVEAKRHKAHELLELASKFLPSSIVTGVILRTVFSFLNSAEGVDIEISEDEDIVPEEQDSSSESDDSEDKPRKKRKVVKAKAVTDVQLNAVQGKKFFARVETGLNAILQGMKDNAGFFAYDKLGLCVQVFAHFGDIVSRKFRLDEDRLFVKTDLNRDLLNVDKEDEDVDEGDRQSVAKRQRLAKERFREKQKEKYFLVQPGASTGRGHWVTEEWKRGKMNASATDSRSKQIGSVDLRAVKSRVLGSMALKVFNGFSITEISTFDTEVKTALAKFVSRSFVSGIAELFQPSAKAIQKLLSSSSNHGQLFNEKAMGTIAKKLMTSMEQLHHSGSDLSFMTMKQQRKTQTADIAITCSSLLLALVNSDESEEWLNQDMMETLASHVRASLDRPALQLAALAILKRLLMSNKFKSATVYDCLKSVGDLIATASNPRVCALCGSLYAQFLIDFPHTEKALGDRLLMLLKQCHFASSSLSRCTALNAVYSFVRAMPAKMLQDSFGEIIFVTLAVHVSAEEEDSVRTMTHQVMGTVMARFVDTVKRNRLIEVVANWPTSMTKYQFVLGAAEVLSGLCSQPNIVAAEQCGDVIMSVIRQSPYLIVPESMDADLLRTRSLMTIVKSVSRLVESGYKHSQSQKLIQYVGAHLLNAQNVSPSVVVEALKFVHQISSLEKVSELLIELPEDVESVRIEEGQIIESCAPWPMLMRVLGVLTRDATESHLEIPSLAMKAVGGLLPLSSGTVKPVNIAVAIKTHKETSEEEVEIDNADLGLFANGTETPDGLDNLDEPIEIVSGTERLVALLKKIRYEVRGLMAKPRESVIRLASLLKLTAALTLSSSSTDNEEVLGLALEVLVRLATINKTAEEMSTEVPEVHSLFELSTLRPIEQIGCLSKMANGALESIEKQYQADGLFTKQLTRVTGLINKSRRDRKISLLNLAVSNPARLAMLRLQKSKKKTEKRQQNAKEKVKRIKGLIH